MDKRLARRYSASCSMSLARCGMALVALVALVVGPSCARKEGATPAERPATVPPDTVEYIARGNEPFWAVSVTRAGIVFSEPDRPDGVRGAYVPPIRRAADMVFRTVLGDSAATPLELTLEEKPCSDGMSDRKYSYAAVARLGDRVLHGCAERLVAAATTAR